jgi:hypothetical protein
MKWYCRVVSEEEKREIEKKDIIQTSDREYDRYPKGTVVFLWDMDETISANIMSRVEDHILEREKAHIICIQIIKLKNIDVDESGHGSQGGRVHNGEINIKEENIHRIYWMKCERMKIKDNEGKRTKIGK